jgi:hypothetical protein
VASDTDYSLKINEVYLGDSIDNQYDSSIHLKDLGKLKTKTIVMGTYINVLNVVNYDEIRDIIISEFNNVTV